MVVFLIFFSWFLFYSPNYMGPSGQLPHPGQPDGDPGAHRAGMVLPCRSAILRSIPDKLGGVLAMFGAIAVLFVLPCRHVQR